MLQTTNYKLNKIELADSPADITVLNANWDKIDTEMKTLEGKTGGTVTGTVTIKGKLTGTDGLEITGDSDFNNNVSIDGVLTMVNPIRSYKSEFLQTVVDITKGTPPSSTIWSYWSVMDKNGFNNEQNRLGHIDFSVEANNTTTMAMFVNKNEASSTETPVGLYCRWLNGITPQIAMSHQPDDNSNDYSIASTQWVRKKIGELSSKVLLVRY